MKNLQLKEIRLQEIAMPLKSAFETSFGVTTARRILLVRVSDENDLCGHGECTAMGEPFYNHETVDSAWMVISNVIVPMLRSNGFRSADEVGDKLAAIRGNRMAIGTVETALWELESIQLGVPLWKHLGGTRGEINCGVSIGLQSSPAALVERVRREVESGYQRIKIKIKPGKDINMVSAVREEFPDILLSVDANAAYDLGRDESVLLELDNYGLLMIEQPLAPGRILDHARLQSRIKTPICLDESITSASDAEQAIAMDACRIINIKLGRVGGHSAAREIQRMAVEKGIPVWCGGMLETGIGRAHNIAMSTLSGFTLPGDVSASARYWEKDITDPLVEVSPRGTITVPNSPGIGYGVREDMIRRFTVRADTLVI